MTDYIAYAKALREELHQCPEIGFDLPKTLAIVHRELDAMGIAYTDKFCKSSVVGVINDEKKAFTIGIRADMDALPIQEVTEKPYKSKIDGQMHACGHDVHTSILLATAKQLSDMKDQLNCRVKLVFSPAEEYVDPGCKTLAENGVMDDIDCIISLHIDPGLPAGQVEVTEGGQGANSMGFTVEFCGTSAHAAYQQKGKDAIAMAVQAYNALEVMVAKEFSPKEPRLLNIGTFHGGNTNNVICDSCKIFGSARSHDDEVSRILEARIREICQGVATMNGGKAEVKVVKFLPFVINHPEVTRRMAVAAEKIVGKENVVQQERNLGGEDFSFLCRKKPGMMFKLGTRGAAPETALALHTCSLDVDTSCLEVGIRTFVQFVLDNMDGISFE